MQIQITEGCQRHYNKSMSDFEIVQLQNPTIFQIAGGLNYRGEWDNGTEYVIGDVVYFEGSSYVSTADANTGNAVTDNSKWQLIAQMGDTGAQGATGVTGGQGIKGDTGNTGSAGAKGDTGSQGAAGNTGVAGAKGDTGSTGSTGAKGDTGSAGAVGATGVGEQGDTGEAGVSDTPGDTGVQGATGANGAAGAKGDTGSAGAKGDTGSQGAVGNTGVGNTGVAGAKGDTGSAGAAGNTGVAGAKGDTGTHGDTGVAGDTGVSDVPGDTGVQGVKGDTGSTGSTGSTGAKGDTGNTGAAGNTGVTGAVGNTGVQGNTGVAGAVGNTGVQGVAGNTGVQGDTGVRGLFGGQSFSFQFSTTTADADPGAGLLRFNHATYSSVTQLFVDLADANATDITAWLDSFDDVTNPITGVLKLFSISDNTKWVLFKVTAWTTATGYRKLTVTYVSHNGALTTTAGDTVMTFTPAGYKGDTGSTGSTGSTGAKGDTGNTGAAGNTGVTGNTGVAGAVGNTGVAGAVGATGAAGNTGVTGATGIAQPSLSVADDSFSGITNTMTAGTGVVLGNVCYVGSDGKMELADMDAVATAFAMAIALGTIADNASGSFGLWGYMRDDSAYNFTPGQPIYLSGTPGAITQTAPSGTDDVVQILGIAMTADIWYFNPQLVQVEHTQGGQMIY